MVSKLKVIQSSAIESVKRRFGIIGNDRALNCAIEMALRVAPTMMNVLITGENGSGKESFSKIIHYYGGQKHGKLIAVNCGALPEGTIDSELFGHEKGAFTGAYEGRKGYFQEANGGTIFLDEIGEMPLATQARLLRVLEYGEFMKVGSSRVERTEVRVVAATHVNLRDAVKRGSFREDLYYRLNTVCLCIPPLRERGNDVMFLFKKFSADFADEYGGMPLRLTEEAMGLLMDYAFPGNIRELKNLVVRMSVLGREGSVMTAEEVKSYLPGGRSDVPALLSTFPEGDGTMSEREILYKVLFDVQRDVMELKKLVFEGFGKDGAGYHLLRKHPLLFDGVVEENRVRSLPPAAVSPSDDVMVVDDGLKVERSSEENKIIPLEEIEKKAIADALKQHKNSRKGAAKALGIPERTLYRKIKKYDL